MNQNGQPIHMEANYFAGIPAHEKLGQRNI